MNSWVANLTKQLNDEELDVLQKIESYFGDSSNDIDLTNTLFNLAHKKSKQKLLGITYTPERIRLELTSTVLGYLKSNKNIANCRICDPCCGSGLFSLTLLEELKKQGISAKNSIEKNIYFGDIDVLSVCIALTNIYYYIKKSGDNPDNIKPNFFVGDFLESNIVYDAFITNPPYIKIQNINEADREKIKEKYKDIFSGSLGIAPVFLKHMQEHLTEVGILGIITQNNFFTSNAASNLRRSIEDNIFRIDTFGSEYIFDGVSAYTCLLYLTNERSTTFDYRRISRIQDFATKPMVVDKQKIHHSKWRLGNDDEIAILKKMETLGTPLGKVCKIWVGIATQCDKAYIVNKINDTWVSTGPRGEQTIVENDIVRPIIKVSDLTDQKSLTKNTKGIIYPYFLIDNRADSMEEEYLRSVYSGAYAALSLWRTDLLARQKGKIALTDWYKWGRIQSMIPTKGKLLTKTFNKGPCFYFDESDSLFSNGYALAIRDEKYNLDYIKSILNSKVFGYYAKLTSFEIQGGYQCYQKNFIEKFCIPSASANDQQSIITSKMDVNEFLCQHFAIDSKTITHVLDCTSQSI